jgi:predicted PurR-regulated permease PerM
MLSFWIRYDMASPLPSSAPTVASAQGPRALSLVPVAVAVVVVGALYLARDVLVPIVLAVLLAFVLAPLVGLLRKLRLGRTFSVVIAMLMALAAVGVTGVVIGQQVAGLATDLPRTAERIQKKVTALGKSGFGRLPDQWNRVASRFQTANPTPPAQRLARRAKPIPVEVHEPPESSWQTARRLLSPILAPLETFLIVVVVAIFILLQREDLRDRVIRLFGSSDLHRTTEAIDEAAARLSRYFLTQLLLNGLFGGVIAVGLYWIGIPSPWLWGVLAGLLRFVPYVGAFLAALPPLLLAVGAEPGWTLAILVVALFLTTEPIMGYVVEPLVYGHSTGLSPLAIIVAAIFWTWLWGAIGLLLSTPMTLCAVVLGRHVKQLEFIDVLFGDRPALTPVESFYQRMLAGDTDEVFDQAEQMLKDRSLSSYYDEVVVPGLRLALADRRRGVVTQDRLDGIVEQTRELVLALDGHDDIDPDATTAPAEPTPAPMDAQRLPELAPPRADIGDARILCLPGSGSADQVVGVMLAQLLGKHGGAVTFGDLTLLSDDGSPAADTICLVSAELRPGTARWRIIEGRVRGRWPGTRIVRGLVRADRESAAPGCVSLHDLVEACSATAGSQSD